MHFLTAIPVLVKRLHGDLWGRASRRRLPCDIAGGKLILCTLLVVLVAAGVVRAEVVRLEVDRHDVFAGGHEFGEGGAYELVEGRLFFEADPESKLNQRITDIEFAPRNERGRVEHWADFFLLKPVDPGKANGCLLYDVHNRGNKLALWTFDDAQQTNIPTTMEHAGNGFLLDRGYTLLWTGWNGDVVEDGTHRLVAGLPVAEMPDGRPIRERNYIEISVDEPTKSQAFFASPWGTPAAYPSVSVKNDGATLTVRERRSEPAVEIPRNMWAFARFEDGKVVPDPTSLYVKAGLKPGWLYDLTYTARDPRVSGLGLAGLRDGVSFFRHASKAAGNPLDGMIDRACIFGISQSGRVIHHFFHEGLNVDAMGMPVFDGAIVHVAGAGKGLFNYRFAMATVYGTQHRGNLYPSDFYPFAPMSEAGDSLARLREQGPLPKIFFVQTSTEYWERAASLLHTDVEGKYDLELDPHVRIYLINGAAHLGAVPAERGNSRYRRNPLRHRGPVLRALLVAMDAWLTDGTEPPPSRYPRIADGTLIDVETYRARFPKIPGVNPPRAAYAPLRLDPGPRWYTDGIADHVPPLIGEPYVTLVPSVGADGNELGGIRLPEVAVPTATYFGWNLRADDAGAAGALAGLHGSWLPLPKQKVEGDCRPSLAELHPTPRSRLDKYRQVVEQLVAERFLLERDAAEMLEAAQSSTERRAAMP